MKKMKFILLVSLLLLFSGFFACATLLPPTPVEKEIETVIHSDVFAKEHVITPVEKKHIQKVVIAADKELKKDQVVIAKQKKEIKADNFWSCIGKIAFGFFIFMCVITVIGCGIKVLRFFHLIP